MGHKPKRDAPKGKRHWFFVLAYLPEEICTWQILKDFIRANLKRDRKPGWTVVEPDTKVGYFSVSSGSDARAVFYALEKNYPKTLIHYYCITANTPVEGPAGCNCHAIYRTNEHSELNTKGWLNESLQYGWNIFEQWSNDAGESIPALNTAFMSTVSLVEPTSPGASEIIQPFNFYPQVSTPAIPLYQSPYAYAPIRTEAYAEPLYTTTPILNPYAAAASSSLSPSTFYGTGGVPVNAEEDENVEDEEEETTKTVNLGVIITNLHFKMKKKDLETVLKENGCPSYSSMKFKTDHRGQCTGSATVTFFTSEDANNAASALDKLFWSGRPMKARVDKNRTTISVSSPPVVNGST